MSKSSKRHLFNIQQLGCILCKHLDLGESPAEIHHIEGFGRSSYTDFLTVPLCPMHHRGANGVHGLSRRGFENRYKLSELDLLGMTLQELNR